MISFLQNCGANCLRRFAANVKLPLIPVFAVKASIVHSLSDMFFVYKL